MAPPTKLEISRTSFASVHDQLNDGFGLFTDDRFEYVVLDARTHAIDVLRRQDNDNTWTEVMKSQPETVRVCINGQLFGPDNLYRRVLTGSVSLNDIEGAGSIREAGRTLPEDRDEGDDRYYFGRSRDNQTYSCALGNPPDEVYEGMGGLGPLIVTNPVTGVGVPVGVLNHYTSDKGKTTIPITEDEWRDCTQRSSKHFEQIDVLDPNEFCAVASSRSARLLLFVINTDDSPGRLSLLRDKLLDAGFDCAAFTDGSNSSCMAVDGEVLVEPHPIKDRLIEAGFKGVRGSRPVSFRVSFNTLDVLDPAVSLGDEGRWNMVGRVNGAEFGSWSGARAIAGETLELGWTAELELSSSSSLVLELEVTNLVGPTLSGVEAPEVSDFKESSNAASQPPFGEGSWVLENRDSFYALHFQIEVL